MNYREFVDQVSEDLREVLPGNLQGATITPRQVDKLQGASYYGISVQPQDSIVGISLDLSAPFEQMESGKAYQDVLSEIGTFVSEGFDNRPTVKTTELFDYEAMKEKLMVQVVPTAGNEELLATVPHVE